MPYDQAKDLEEGPGTLGHCGADIEHLALKSWSMWEHVLKRVFPCGLAGDARVRGPAVFVAHHLCAHGRAHIPEYGPTWPPRCSALSAPHQQQIPYDSAMHFIWACRQDVLPGVLCPHACFFGSLQQLSPSRCDPERDAPTAWNEVMLQVLMLVCPICGFQVITWAGGQRAERADRGVAHSTTRWTLWWRGTLCRSCSGRSQPALDHQAARDRWRRSPGDIVYAADIEAGAQLKVTAAAITHPAMLPEYLPLV